MPPPTSWILPEKSEWDPEQMRAKAPVRLDQKVWSLLQYQPVLWRWWLLDAVDPYVLLYLIDWISNVHNVSIELGNNSIKNPQIWNAKANLPQRSKLTIVLWNSKDLASKFIVSKLNQIYQEKPSSCPFHPPSIVKNKVKNKKNKLQRNYL